MVSNLAGPECYLYLEEDHTKKNGHAVHISIRGSCGYVKHNDLYKTIG